MFASKLNQAHDSIKEKFLWCVGMFKVPINQFFSFFWVRSIFEYVNRTHFAVTPMHSTHLAIGCVNSIPLYLFFFFLKAFCFHDPTVQCKTMHSIITNTFMHRCWLTNCRRQQTICSANHRHHHSSVKLLYLKKPFTDNWTLHILCW